jgi:uncharacterized Zn-binding protein involved in type VI secretion
MGIAKATLPNVCKMPGPPAPFVPSPLPNIAKSGSSPNDYSTSVKIEGNTVAIRGAMFESMGDMASKGTGGGLISANTHGPAKFITPGSMSVKIEGKSVHLLGEPMLNNCGANGSPPNTGATMAGVDQRTAPEDCPGHDLIVSDLTEEAEQKRREALENKKQEDLAKAHEAGELAAYHEKTGFSKAVWRGRTNLTPDTLLGIGVEAEGYAEDKAFEQKVAKDTKAVWTGLKYKCKHCSLRGEIDIFTPNGIIKECKRPGTVQKNQIEKYHLVGPMIFGAAFKGVHMAIPGAKVRNLRDSASGQGLGLGKDFDMQLH